MAHFQFQMMSYRQLTPIYLQQELMQTEQKNVAFLSTEVKFSQWAVHFDWQQYISRETLALFYETSEETPAFVNFSIFTLGVDYQF